MMQHLHFEESFLQKYLYMCMRIFTGAMRERKKPNQQQTLKTKTTITGVMV